MKTQPTTAPKRSEALKKAQKKYYENNKVKFKEYFAKYYENNKDKFKLSYDLWIAKNSEYNRGYQKAYQKMRKKIELLIKENHKLNFELYEAKKILIKAEKVFTTGK